MWIAKVTSHIPQTGAQILRYCGRYSNASRGKAGKRAPAVDQSANASKEVSESQWSMQRKATWAAPNARRGAARVSGEMISKDR
jgi:hypothetical protein